MRIAVATHATTDPHVHRIGRWLLGSMQSLGAQWEPWMPPHPPQARVALQFARPDQATAAEGKKNVLLWAKTTPGKLDPADIVRMAGFDLILGWSKDQVRQISEARAVTGRSTPARIDPAVAPPFMAVDPSRPLLKVPGKALRFLWLGSTMPQDWQSVLTAWRDAFQATLYKDVTLSALGTPSDEDGEEKGHGITVVHRWPKLDAEWATLYGSHDVVIATQTWGLGLGAPFVEAQAAGCLVVGPEAGTCAAACSPGRAVLTETPQDLPKALKAVSEHWGSEDIEILRATGCQAARKRDYRVIAEGLYGLLQDAAYKGMRAVS